MKRQTDHEQIHRLSVKILDQVFIAHACEGLGCSLCDAQALTELIKEVYFPWLTQPEAIQAGQLAMVAVSADEPEYQPCEGLPLGETEPQRIEAFERLNLIKVWEFHSALAFPSQLVREFRLVYG